MVIKMNISEYIMKKRFFLAMVTVLFCIMFMGVCANADEYAKRSEYRAFIDYMPIDIYTIDDYTYIDAEELVNYGFNVDYNEEARSINIERIRYASPTYSRELWEKSISEKNQARIIDTDIKVYLEGKQIDCFYADGKVLIMIDNLASLGEFDWNAYNKTVSITIFQHELEEALNNADNVVEMEYDGEVTFFKSGTAKYRGQVNEQNLPHGIGVAEFKYDVIRIKYLGYFSYGKPDGVVYKETHYLPHRGRLRDTYFMGEIDGSKEAIRESIYDYKYYLVEVIREPNFGVSDLPIEAIPYEGKESMPDRTVYKKGFYYERWDGMTGCHEYRIWHDGEESQLITDICFYGRGSDGEQVNCLREENKAVKYTTEFYEYKNGKKIFYDGHIHTVGGDPVVLNSPAHGSGQIWPEILVLVNGEQVVSKNKWDSSINNPIMKNDRVLVPMRAIFEKLGSEVTWDETTETVTAVKDGRTLSLQINNRDMYFDGELFVSDVEPVIFNDSTYVPVRVISEVFFAEVIWHDDI